MPETTALPFEQLQDHINYDLGHKFMDFESLHNATQTSRNWRAFFQPIKKRRVARAEVDPRESQLHLLAARGAPYGKSLWERLDDDERLDRAVARGDMHIRWVPHVLSVDNLSICRVDAVGGGITFGRCPNESNPNDNENIYHHLEVDNNPQPAINTWEWTASLRLGVHHGTVNAIGLDTVFCRGEHDSTPEDTDEMLATQVVKLFVSEGDFERFVGLDHLDNSLPTYPDTPSITGRKYLASFPFSLNIGCYSYREVGMVPDEIMETHPSLDKLFALHVDYNDEGATAITTAYADFDNVVVRRIADAKGAPESTSVAEHMSSFPHGLEGDITGYLGYEPIRVMLDNDYIFVANSTNIKVFKRGANHELILHINSSLRNAGPAFDLSLDAVAARMRVSPSRSVPRRHETVPNNSSQVRRVEWQSQHPGDVDYADITVNHQYVEHDGFAFKPETLAIAGKNLVFAAEKKFFVVPEYAEVLRTVAASNDPLKAFAPHLVEFCLDDPDFAAVAYKQQLAYATSNETFFFDLNEIPPLPAAKPFRLHAHAVPGATRDFTKGASFNTRFMLGPAGLVETVSLTPEVEGEYCEATEGFHEALQWKPEWNDVQEDEWLHWYHPCAVRVFSFAPSEQFAATPAGRSRKRSHEEIDAKL